MGKNSISPRGKGKTAPQLRPGDVVALIAPASPFDPERFREAVRWLEGEGLSVTHRPDVFDASGYLAGSDLRRAREFRRAFLDPSIRALFVARGGYGSIRLLDLLEGDRALFSARAPRKIVSGMSDLTVLLNHLSSRTGCVTAHGPVLAGDLFAGMSLSARRGWLSRFMSPSPFLLRAPRDYRLLRPGEAEGRLWGGNLSMVVSAIGTPFSIPAGGILFLEEVAEPPYRIDRMFAQLALSGSLGSLRAMLLGDFTDPRGRPHSQAWIRGIVERYVPPGIPVVSGLKAGHDHADVVLPIGGAVRLDSGGTRIHLPALVESDG